MIYKLTVSNASIITKQRIKRVATSYLMIVLFFLSSKLHSQNDNNRKEFNAVICNYYLPSNLDGLSESAFWVTPRVRIDRYEASANIILDIKKIQSTAADSNPSYKHSYNYNGKKYGDQDVGFEPFIPVRATNVTYEVIVTYGSQSWTKRVDGMTNQFGPIDKDAKASEVNVYVKIVNLMFNGKNQIENKIQELIKPKEKETVNAVSSTSSNSNINKQNTTSAQNQNTPKTTSPTYSSIKNEEPIVYSNKIEVSGKGNAQVYQQNGESYILYENGTKQKISTENYNQTLTTLKENEKITSSNQRIAKGNEKIQRERDSIAKINESATFGNYVNPMGISTGSSTLDSFNKGYAQGQQIVDIATGLIDLFTPSPEQIRIRAEKKQRAQADAEKKKLIEKTVSEGLDNYTDTKSLEKYLADADKGDENARMILIFEIFRKSYVKKEVTQFLPNVKNWIEEGVKNKNLDAMNFIGYYAIHSLKRFDNLKYTEEEGLKILEEAVILNSEDAMFTLGQYYNSEYLGNDPKKAFYFYVKAAENNLPDAMYALGQIYLNKSNYKLKAYKIEKNTNLGCTYIHNSLLVKDYYETLYYKLSTFHKAFIKFKVYKELALMYENGKGCPIDNEMAKNLYSESEKSLYEFSIKNVR